MGRRLLATVALAVAVLAVPAGVFGGHALADDPLDVHVVDVDDGSFPIVRAIIRVDHGARPVDALTPAQVQVTESGAPATVASVQSAVDSKIPLSLVLVVDVSGSMAGAPLDRAKAAATTMVGGMADGDSAAVVAFSDKVNVIQPMTTDRQAVLDAIGRLAVGGNTALYDAVTQASHLVTPGSFGRRAVVLLTDGQESVAPSAQARSASLDAVTTSGALVYTLGYGADLDQQYLQDVAQRSGGRFFAVPGPEQVAGAFSLLTSLLRSQFVITATSSAPAAIRDRTVTVAVQAPEGAGSEMFRYASRRQFAVPSQPTLAPTVVQTAVATVSPSPSGSRRGGQAAVAGAVLVLAGGVALLMRRRQRAFAPLSHPDARPLPVPEVHTSEASPGRLVVRNGDETVAQFDVGVDPFLVGTDATCRLRLQRAPGVAGEHARVWTHDGRPLIHHLAKGYFTGVNGQAVEWGSIGGDDEIAIGPYTIRYEAGVMAAAALPARADDAGGQAEDQPR